MNWTRERLKTNGKIAFKKNYWACVAVAVIMGIITGLSSISGGRTGSGASQNSLYGNDGFSFLISLRMGIPICRAGNCNGCDYINDCNMGTEDIRGKSSGSRWKTFLRIE